MSPRSETRGAKVKTKAGTIGEVSIFKHRLKTINVQVVGATDDLERFVMQAGADLGFVMKGKDDKPVVSSGSMISVTFNHNPSSETEARNLGHQFRSRLIELIDDELGVPREKKPKIHSRDNRRRDRVRG